MTLCWTRWCFCSLVSLSKQVEYRYGGAGYITYRCLPTGSNLEQQEYQTTLYLLLPFSCPVLSCSVLSHLDLFVLSPFPPSPLYYLPLSFQFWIHGDQFHSTIRHIQRNTNCGWSVEQQRSSQLLLGRWYISLERYVCQITHLYCNPRFLT